MLPTLSQSSHLATPTATGLDRANLAICRARLAGTDLALSGPMRFATILLVGSLLAAPAFAAPLVQNGSTVRVVLPEGKKAATALRADKAGWTLKFKAQSGMVNLIDVTAGAAPVKYVISLDSAEAPGVVVLDNDRFVAGHAYRVELRDHEGGVQQGHVYLVPPKQVSTAKVSFSDSDEGSSDDGIRVRDKGSL